MRSSPAAPHAWQVSPSMCCPDFVESLWPTAEELFPLPSLNSWDDSLLAPPGGDLGHEASYSLTDDDFMAVLLDSHNPGVGGQRRATVDGQLSRRASASTKSLHSLDSAARAEQPITPEKRRERKTEVGRAPCAFDSVVR